MKRIRRRPVLRARLRVTLALLLIVALVATLGPAASQRFPSSDEAGAAAAADAPKQQSGSAEGVPDRPTPDSPAAPAVNRATAVSLQSKYPPLTFPEPVADKRSSAKAVPPPAPQIRGFDAQASKELPQQRTTYSSVYANPDGTQTTVYGQDPLNFPLPGGGYGPVDTTAVPDQAGGWRKAGDELQVHMGQTSGSMRISDASGHEVAFTLLGARAIAGRAEGNAVGYPDVLPNADMRVEFTAGAAKEWFVLKSPDAPHAWEFALDLKGLEAKIADGQIVFADQAGAVVLRVPAGYMIDSSRQETGEPATSHGLTYRLGNRDGKQVLRVELDSGWLRDPARVYPVRVDPTVVKESVSTGNMVVENGARYTNHHELRIGRSGGKTASSFLRFGGIGGDLKDNRIFGAQLQLTNFWSGSCTPRPMSVHPVTADWGSSGTPPTGAALGGGVFSHGYMAPLATRSNCPTAHELIDLGVGGRDLVQQWASGSPNHGLALQAPTDPAAWKRFTGFGTANPPRLYVTHSPYNADYRIDRATPEPPVTRATPGKVKITVTNRGAQAWSRNDFALGYRAYDRSGTLRDSHVAAELPGDVARGASVTLDAEIKAIGVGSYLLDFSMLRKPGDYFTDHQVAPARIGLDVYDVPPFIKQQYPPNGASVQTLTPQLWANGIDVDPPAGSTLKYRFEVCEKGADDNPVNCFSSAHQTSPTWTVPDKKLFWNKIYLWRSFAFDGNSESEALPFSAILSAVPQPAITSHMAMTPHSGSDRDFDPMVGNYYSSAVDVQIPTAGPDLSVIRTYNTLDPRRDHWFGTGWATKYDMRVVRDYVGNVLVTYPDGQQMRFGLNPDGTYAPPQGRFAAFKSVPEGGWTLTDKSATTYRFDSSGRLTGYTDGVGRGVILFWDGENPVRALDIASNRQIVFQIQDRKVSNVFATEVNGQIRQWKYFYEGNRLRRVEDPMGNSTRYDYVDQSRFRTVVNDTTPDGYWRLGDQTGDVAVSQVALNRGKDNGKYKNVVLGAPGAVPGSADSAATFNGSSSSLQLPDGAVKKSRDLAVELWFKTSGSGVLLGYQQNDLAGAVQNAYTPALYVGTNGKLHGQFADGTTAPMVTPGVVNDNKWHHVVLSGSLATQWLYLDGVQVASKQGVIDHGNQTKAYVGAGFVSGNWPAKPTNDHGYFAGAIDEVALFTKPLGDNAVREHFQAAQPSEGLSKIVLPSSRIAAEVEYDTVGERVKTYTDRNGGKWRLGVPVVTGEDNNLIRTVQFADPGDRNHTFDYDPVRGRILRTVTPLGLGVRPEDQTGEPAGEVGYGIRTYDYDDEGNQNTIVSENLNKVTLGFDQRGNVISKQTCLMVGQCQTEHFGYYFNSTNPLDPVNDKVLWSRDGRSTNASDNRYLTTYSYNAKGDLLTQEMPDGGKVTHTYTTGTEQSLDDAQSSVPADLLLNTVGATGENTNYRYYKSGDLGEIHQQSGMRTRFVYDVGGRRTSSTIYVDAFPDGIKTTYEYDALSRVIAETGPATTNSVTGVKHQARTVTAYDEDGNVKREETTDVLGGDPARVTAREYDDHGRLVNLVNPEGKETRYGFDVFGNRMFEIDASGVKRSYAYTARNEVAEVRLHDWHGGVVDPAGGDGRPGDGEGDTDPANSKPTVLESFRYDESGRQILHVDAMGRTTRNNYYANDLVAQVVAEGYKDPVTGYVRDLVLENNSYDGAGNLTKQTTAGNRTTTYEYDVVSRLIQTWEDPGRLDRSTRLTYDRSGNVIRTEKSGNPSNAGGGQVNTAEVTEFEYNASGQRIKQTVHNGLERLVTQWAYDERGMPTAVTDPRGNPSLPDYTTTMKYDELARPIQATGPRVRTESNGGAPADTRATMVTGYDTFGSVTHTKDPLGRVTTAEYDKLGQLVKASMPSYTPPGATAPITPTKEIRYDAMGRVIKQIDARQHATELRYDQLGRLLERHDPQDGGTAAGVWKYSYTMTGLPLSATSPTGARVEATYDELGRKVTSTAVERFPNPTSHTTRYRHDDAGNVVSVENPAGEKILSTYDKLNQLITAVDPAGVTTQRGYDRQGRLVRASDGAGVTKRLNYDLAGRKVSEFDVDGQWTGSQPVLRERKFTYDPAGNVKTAEDWEKRVTTFSYDSANRLSSQVEPVADGKTITTSFGYDAAGNRTRFTDGRTNKTVFTYNSLNLPESVIEPSTAAHPAAADRTWTQSYDAAGNATRLTAPGNVNRDRTFDALNRMVTETGSGAETQTADKTRTYDADGRLRVAGSNAYTYNDRGGLLTATGSSGASSFEYDTAGRVITRTDAAGTTRYGYLKGRLDTVTDGATGGVLTYGYNEAGKVKTVDYGAGRVRTYDYDNLARPTSDVLKEANGTVLSSIAYTYDPNDRVKTKTTAGLAGSGQNSYSYDHQGRMLSWTDPAGKATEYGWDDAGNRVKAGDKNATYDERNRVLADGDYTYAYSPRGSLSSRTSSGMEEKYSFDAFDRLVKFGTTEYTYDDFDRLATRGGQKFSYAGMERDTVSDGVSRFGRGPDGSLVSLSQGTDSRLTLSDRHGDVVGALAPAAGGVVDSTAYDPYGKRIASTGASRTVGFQGDWTDPDNGNVNMGARWYQPGSGTFASRDSIELPFSPSISANRYSYVLGSPLNYFDPDGHGWFSDLWDKAGGIVHTALDVAGMIPGIGEIADLANAAIYAVEGDWENAAWSAAGAIPFGGNAATAAKWARKAGDFIGNGRRAGRHADDAIGLGRRYGDDVAGAARRGVDDAASAAARKASAVAAARKAAAAAAAAAARRAAAILAKKKAAAAAARGAAERTAKRNPIPTLKAALKPVFKGTDLVSSSPLMPARVVQAFKADVQDSGRVFDFFKKQVVGDGAVVQNVAETVTAVSEVAQPGASPDEILSALGGLAGRNKSRGKHHDESSGGADTSCVSNNSFDPNTLVVMGDGSRKPIKDVRVGDKVLAKDPTTGRSAVRVVTDTRSYASKRTLVEVGVASEAGRGSVVATDEHPFWVESEKRWSHAVDLRAGHRLETGDHRDATVTGTRSWSEVRRVYNLTVDSDHTYYVVAGQTPVLTHNCDKKLDFVHGTTSTHADNIDANGLSGQAARANAHGGLLNQPGSLFTYQVNSTDSETLGAAASFGATRTKTGERPSILIFQMCQCDYDRLKEAGHIRTRVTDEVSNRTEHIFGPAAMPYLERIYRRDF
ncbi:RHS repeat-associated core domain-containing protein [Amycolatopsis keratiniphila]|uniref:RHS repeat-associated core domain-containing protein n=1 Tax=Amycolatopsis keratiniphila TaxID=129921 RepID=UPI0034100B8A